MDKFFDGGSKSAKGADHLITLPEDAKAFFDKVQKDDLNDRKLAGNLPQVEFQVAQEGSAYVLKEISSDANHTMRDIGRFTNDGHGVITNEELEYHADGKALLRKTNEIKTPNTLTSKVFESTDVDNPDAQLNQVSLKLSTLKDGKEATSLSANFHYAADGTLDGEHKVFTNSKSTETIDYRGANLAITSDVTVFADSTSDKLHDDSKTYSLDMKDGKVVGQHLLEVAHEGGRTTTTYFDGTVDDKKPVTWTATKQVQDDGKGHVTTFGTEKKQ